MVCDYRTGFRAPEMVKLRPAVVISPRSRTSRLCTVVPLSTTEPSPLLPWHYEVPVASYWRPHDKRVWVKGDMVATVGFDRLSMLRQKDRQGKTIYRRLYLTPDDLQAIRACVRAALQL